MKRIASFIALSLAAVAFAGQVCTIDPPRPAGNTATDGFYVLGSKLYDPTGEEFRVRGVNFGHGWDQVGGYTGIPAAGANTARLVLDMSKPAATNVANVQRLAATGVVPMPTNFSTTCKGDQASLAAAVDQWVAQAPAWTPLSSTVLVNIANEWGPGDNVGWRDGYVLQIPRMRAAGYTGTLVVDTGGCGQNLKDVLTWGADVEAADPLHNVLFSVHVYGNFYLSAPQSWMQPQLYPTALPRLKASGLPIIIGEFGPGRNIGPSPTLLKPEQVVADAEANGLGWLAWSWDDNDLAGCGGDDNWFAMVTKCGQYTGNDATELTLFGRTIVPLLKLNAKRAALKFQASGSTNADH
jgi:mannan endo-1,4-beta-mannosidase